MGAEATCERLDGTSNGIGRGGRRRASPLDVSPTLFQCWQEPMSREGGEAQQKYLRPPVRY